MELSAQKTIKLFLLEGDPTGAKKVQLSNWSGLAFIIPRSKLENITKRDELQKQCLYFLLGGTSVSPEVYIGEAENFQKRISQHQEKDFWNTCVVFLSKDENLSKAHIKFLEATFIADCKEANRAKLHNAISPEGSKLSEEDESDMREFKQNIKLILSVLGYSFHETSLSVDVIKEEYFIKTKGLIGKGIYTAEGMVVLEGSQVAKEETASIQGSLRNARLEKIQAGALVDKGGYYEVVRKITFSSVSTAAAFIRGGSTNGWTDWKNSDGVTIDTIERKKLES